MRCRARSVVLIIGLTSGCTGAAGDDACTDASPGDVVALDGTADGGAEDDAGGADAAGADAGSTLERARSQLAIARCDFWARCEPFRLEARLLDRAACVAAEDARLATEIAAIEDAVALGRGAWDEAAMSACVGELGAADCLLGLGPSSACDHLFVGRRGLGEACFDSRECDPTAQCARAALGECGQCVPRRGDAAPCDDATLEDPCAAGLACRLVCTSTRCDRHCIDVRRGVGEACTTAGSTGICRGALTCQRASGGPTCQPPPGEGEYCEGAISCDFWRGFTCFDDACRPMGLFGRGDPCDGPGLCREPLVCAIATFRCEDPPAVGEPCANGSECAPDAYCDATRRCAPAKAQGATCTSGRECASGLTCMSVSGRTVCEAYVWRTCE